MNTINQFLAQHLHSIAIAVAATSLVLFGGDINGFIKRLVGSSRFIIRLGIFVVVCIFLYGLGTVFLTKVLAQFLASLPRIYLTPVVFAIFLLLGFIANSRKQI